MIYYFSATGNSAWIAQQIAEQTDDAAIDMLEFLKTGTMPPSVESGERLGLVFPVHAWRPPGCVLDFVEKLRVAPDCFVYAVCTMGETCGNCMAFLQKYFRLDSAYSVQMPNNYILLGKPDSEGVVTRKIATAEKRLAEISQAVLAERPETLLRRGPLPALLTWLAGGYFQRFACHDRKFYAESSCTACGLCAKLCAVNNISMENGRPAWHGHCIHCMACLQNCPEQAIQYGKKTKHRRRYVFAEKTGQLPDNPSD